MINVQGNDFIISDLHLTHENIIRYCNRPYEKSEEGLSRMKEDLLALFDKLPINCTIWNLGDLMDTKANHSLEEVRAIVNRMRGPTGERKLYILLGNHDVCTLNKRRMDFYYEAGFDKVYDTPIMVNNKFIFSHEPVYIPEGFPFVNIYGHTHDKAVNEDSFKYNWDEHYAKCKAAKKAGEPEPELIMTNPERIINAERNYLNVCYDYNHKFLRFSDILKRFA